MVHLVIEEQPASMFYKDEGGKSNQLSFRISLQGDPVPDALISAASNGFLPLSVVPVYETGEAVDRPNILEILGGTVVLENGEQQLTNLPCLSTTSLTGGVRFRITAVSKRLGNRGIGLRVSVPGFPEIPALTSEATMVFSKRKNKLRRQSSSGTPTSTGSRRNSFRFEEDESESQSEGEPQMGMVAAAAATAAAAAAAAKRKRAKPSSTLPPPKQLRNIDERLEDLDQEQKKLLQAVTELRKLNQQMQQIKS
ncbi:hypothetical protein BASA81_009066 [Batrachochytrium salamandrivorans]|nr:hypothetical protein BASA81_009066 [Batrachochytrium salamandrivorans]